MLIFKIILTILISLFTIALVLDFIRKAVDLMITPLDVLINIIVVLLILTIGGSAIYAIWYFTPNAL